MIEKDVSIGDLKEGNFNMGKCAVKKTSKPDEVFYKKKKSPMVSIVIPIYNVKEYVGVCLESLINQTFFDIEILCVDDGSNDGTLEILREYERRDGRISVISIEHQGAACARNIGLDYARGKYIDFVDPDDFLKPDMVDVLFRRAEEVEAEIVISGLLRFDCLGNKCIGESKFGWQVKGLPKAFPATAIPDRIFTAFLPSPCNKFFNADFVRRHSLKFQSLPRSNDLLFSFTALAVAERITVVDESYYCYRMGRPGSSQTTTDFDPSCVCKAYSKLRESIEARGVFKIYGKSFFCAAFSSCMYTLGMIKNEDVARAFFQKLKECWSAILFTKNLNLENFLGSIILFKKYLAFQNTDSFDDFKPLLKSTKESPMVSVIMPVYNSELYLRAAIESIIGQTYSNLELICIDDGSTDKSVQIMKEYAAKDVRIRIISHKNSGLGASRNKGLLFASGKYVYFIDSDDLLDKNALTMLVELAERENLDQVVFSAKSFPDKHADLELLKERIACYDKYYMVKDSLVNVILTGREFFAKAASIGNIFVSAPLRLMRIDMLLRYGCRFSEGYIHEDEAFTYRAIWCSSKICAINERYYHRRVRTGSITTASDSGRHVIGVLKAIDVFIKSEFMMDVDVGVLMGAQRILNSLIQALIKFVDNDYKLLDASVAEFMRREGCEKHWYGVCCFVKQNTETVLRSVKLLIDKNREELKKSDDAHKYFIAAKDARIDNLECRVKLRTKEVVERNQLITAKDKRIDDLERRIKLRTKEVVERNQLITAKDKRIDDLERRVKLRTKEVVERNQLITAKDKRIDDLERRFKLCNNELNSLRKSVSYRLGLLFTYPIRKLRRMRDCVLNRKTE